MLRRIKRIRKIPVNLPWYWQKSFSICLYIKRTIHINHQPRFKRIREKMQIALENRKKVVIDSPRSLFKRKNKVEEGRASSSRMMREQESTNLRADKMMRGRMEPFAMTIMVRVMPTIVQSVKQIVVIPQMTSPQKDG